MGVNCLQDTRQLKAFFFSCKLIFAFLFHCGHSKLKFFTQNSLDNDCHNTDWSFGKFWQE